MTSSEVGASVPACSGDDSQVDVAVGVGLTTRDRPEEDDGFHAADRLTHGLGERSDRIEELSGALRRRDLH